MFRFSPPHLNSCGSTRATMRRFTIVAVGAALSLSLTLGAVQSSGAQGKDAEKQKNSKKSKNDKSVETPKRLVLVFPPDISSDSTAEQLTDIITDVIKSRLSVSGAYRSVLYSRSLPTVKRAVNEQTLSAADASAPFAQDEKVRKLAQLTGHDMVIVSSIDDYQYDEAKNQVSLVMSARLLDFTGGNKKVVATAGESLTSAEAPKSKKQIDVALDTARTLTETLMAQLLKPAKPAPEK